MLQRKFYSEKVSDKCSSKMLS